MNFSLRKRTPPDAAATDESPREIVGGSLIVGCLLELGGPTTPMLAGQSLSLGCGSEVWVTYLFVAEEEYLARA